MAANTWAVDALWAARIDCLSIITDDGRELDHACDEHAVVTRRNMRTMVEICECDYCGRTWERSLDDSFEDYDGLLGGEL